MLPSRWIDELSDEDAQALADRLSKARSLTVQDLPMPSVRRKLEMMGDMDPQLLLPAQSITRELLDPSLLNGGGGSGATYVHTQSTPATVWAITHSLNAFPNVTTLEGGVEIEGDVVYTSLNDLTVTFTAAVGGVAYLS